MKIVLDLDGTICSLRKEWQDYADVVPNFQAVEKIQKLKEQGFSGDILTCNNDAYICNGCNDWKMCGWQ